MREIKFRAWNTNEGHMWYPAAVGSLGENEAYAWPFGSDELLRQEGAEIMQYTGLKDKNGKEIYEGDVVNYIQYNLSIYPQGKSGNWEVEYEEYNARFVLTDNISISYGFSQLDGSSVIDNEYQPDIEVIGNVHENPELIK